MTVDGKRDETMKPTPLGPIATGDQRPSLVEMAQELAADLDRLIDRFLGEKGGGLMGPAVRQMELRDFLWDNKVGILRGLQALSAHEGRGSPVVRSEEGNGTGQKSSPPVPSVGEEESRDAAFWKAAYDRCNARVCELLKEKLARPREAEVRENEREQIARDEEEGGFPARGAAIRAGGPK